jgi:hypothetical protein
MIIKLLIAICVLLLTVVTLSFEATSKKTNGSLVRKIKYPRYVAIASALGIFIFGAINEYIVLKDNEASSSQINQLQNDLKKSQNTINESKSIIESSLKNTIRLEESLSLLEKSMRGQFARVSYSELRFKDLPFVANEIKKANGDNVYPVNGDEIRWHVSCTGKTPIPTDLVDTEFCGSGYGKIVANFYKFPLDGKSGSKTFIGTRSTGGIMRYERPWDDYPCNPLYDQLVASQCAVEVQVFRDLNSIQLGILNRAGYSGTRTGDLFWSTLTGHFL